MAKVIKAAKTESYGRPSIDLEELKAFFLEHSTVPDDDDEVFILDHRITSTEGEADPNQYNEPTTNFDAVFSTKRLLRNIINMATVHADGTYKLLWRGCPAVVIGTTDNTKEFHVVAVALCSSENTDSYEFCFKAIAAKVFDIYGAKIEDSIENLVSDAAGAIKTGFERVIPNKKKITCWFHVKKSIKDRTEFDSPINRALALKDLTDLHNAPDEDFFQIGANLLKKKWEKKAKSFAQGLDFWLRPQNRNWYLGSAHRVPKTNNALEAFNGRIKRDFTLHERSTIAVFKVKIFRMLNTISLEYRDNVKSIHREVKTNDHLWYKGLEWARMTKGTITEEQPNMKKYFIPDGKRDEITENEVNAYKRKKQKTFDNLVKAMYSLDCFCPG